jgi:hypothetical protein
MGNSISDALYPSLACVYLPKDWSGAGPLLIPDLDRELDFYSRPGLLHNWGRKGIHNDISHVPLKRKKKGN